MTDTLPEPAPEQRADPAAAAVRAILRAGADGAVGVALDALCAARGVSDARWLADGRVLPGRNVLTVPLETGGAIAVRAEDPADPGLTSLVAVVAAALDGVRAAAPMSDIRDAVFAQMPIVVTVYEPGGSLRWTNLTHWPDGAPVRPGDNVATVLPALVHPDDQAELAATLASLHRVNPGGQARHTVRVRREGGEWMIMEVIVLDRVDDPAINGLVGFGLDITALHDTEYTLRVTVARLSTLVDSLQAGIMLQDAERTVLFANEALTRLYGIAVAPVELIGMSSDDVVRLRSLPPDHYRELDEMGARCLERGVAVRGAEVSLGDRTVEVDYVPVRMDDRRHGQLWMIRDITEQTEMRRTLVKRNEELSRLSALKTEFVATISHELRTPLTALSGLTELLVSAGDDAERQLAAAVDRNVARMRTLVETLLLLAKVESRSLALSTAPTDLDALLRRQVQAATVKARELAVDLRLADSPAWTTVIEGDQQLLGQMLHHVLAAAVGGSGPGSTVEVWSRRDRAAGVWAVEVTDQHPLTVGAGRLFTTVQRGDHDANPLTGSALGLALARAISERHGGAIYLKPAERGLGTTVRVELPLTGPPPDELRPAS